MRAIVLSFVLVGVVFASGCGSSAPAAPPPSPPSKAEAPKVGAGAPPLAPPPARPKG
jgi:hypothetical protein